MSKKRVRQQRPTKQSAAPPRKKRHRVTIVIGVMLCLSLAGGLLAQWRSLHASRPRASLLHSAAVPQPQATPSLTLAKEYIYAGSRLMATEEPSASATNLALNKAATQSSTATDSGTGITGSANLAVDGNTNGAWANGSVTHTYLDNQAWWQVDLGAMYSIQRVDVWNRTDCCGERLTNFNVLVLDQNQATVATFPTPGQGGTPTSITVNRTGRYVRVQLVGTNYLSLAEVQVWGTSSSGGTGRTNVALAANGGVASASSVHTTYLPSGAINGDRKGINLANGGAWNDATPAEYPDWIQVDFNGSKNIDEIDLFMLQDNYTAPVEPTETMTFTQHGLTNFEVQYWNSTQWVTVPGGSVTGNDRVWRKFTFPAITTNKIRVWITLGVAGDPWSRVIELEAYQASAASTPDPCAATFVSQSVPTSMIAGQSYNVTVRMRNTGSNTWTAATQYSLGSQNPQDNMTWSLNRVIVPSTIAAGAETSFNFTVTAPATAGTYNFQWRMVQDNVGSCGWFGESTPNLAVTVTAPSTGSQVLSVATGADNSPRVLWRLANGAAQVWTMSSDGTSILRRSAAFGPYTDWTVKAISVGQDNVPYLLWTHLNGTISLWKLNPDNSHNSDRWYGPISDWAAVSLGEGADNQPWILWRHTLGQISLWKMNPDWSYSSVNHGPLTGWEALSIAVGSNNYPRLLWRNTDGRISVWKVDPNGNFVAATDSGPYGGWSGTAIAVGRDDNLAHVLWNHTSGEISLWSVNDNGAYLSSQHHGPFGGWTAVTVGGGGVSTDGNNLVRLLWRHTDGRMSFWTVNSDNTRRSSTDFPPP